jgi:hypothetical protein
VIKIIKNEDKTYTLTYFDKVIGHVNRCRLNTDNSRTFRVATVHGQLAYAKTLGGAKRILMEMHH